MWERILIVSLLVFVINVPFGYWRAHVRKFSLQWVLSIHLPVPVIVLMRFLSGIGFQWFTYLFLVAAFFLGQKTGSLVYRKMKQINGFSSSNIFADVWHLKRSAKLEN